MFSHKYAIGTALLALSLFVSLAPQTIGSETTAAGTSFQESADGARRIKPEDAKELISKGQAVLVDVRGEASYKAGHIKGALNIPAPDIRARAKELPAGKMILPYCS